MNDKDRNAKVITTQPSLFKIEHTALSRPGSLVEQSEKPSVVEPNPAQPDMFGIEYFR